MSGTEGISGFSHGNASALSRIGGLRANGDARKWRKRWLALATALVVCVKLGVNEAVPAAEGVGVTALSGTWHHVADAKLQRQRYAAIDQATEDMGRLYRGLARDKLRKATTPAQVLTISEDAATVKISTGSGSVAAPTDGSSKEITTDNGKAKIRATRKNGNLTVAIRGESGSRTMVYRLSNGGRELEVDVEMSSEKIGKPVRYSIDYVRKKKDE